MNTYKVTSSFTTSRKMTEEDESSLTERIGDNVEVKRLTGSGQFGYTVTQTVDAADPDKAVDKVGDYAGKVIGVLDRVLVEAGDEPVGDRQGADSDDDTPPPDEDKDAAKAPAPDKGKAKSGA